MIRLMASMRTGHREPSSAFPGVSGGKETVILDDRSLNGVFVNGKRVEWSPLEDGDEILVGRHRLHYFVVAQAPVATETAASTSG